MDNIRLVVREHCASETTSEYAESIKKIVDPYLCSALKAGYTESGEQLRLRQEV